MNLAQCIDPEWAQRFFAPASRGKTAAPKIERRQEADLVLVPTAPKPAIAARIREALALSTGRDNALTLAQIREAAPEITSLQMAQNVGKLRAYGHVQRAGEAGEYRYWLTAQGRELLET